MTAPTLEDLRQSRRWVAWAAEGEGARPKKIPKDPATGNNARSNDPTTWGRRQQADERWRMMGKGSSGGIGFMLGKLGLGITIAGVDLDGCLEDGIIADWANEVIDRFNSYAEISPSGKGVKLFFQARSSDVQAVRALVDDKLRVAFSAGTHREIAIDFGRYYTVTGNKLGTYDRLRLVSLEDMRWLITDAGPRFGGGTKSIDHSRSGDAFRFMQARPHHSYDRVLAAILKDRGPAGDWAREYEKEPGQRQLRRCYERSRREAAKVGRTDGPVFPLIPFDQIMMATESAYAIKGLLPYPGLVVVWGPPKCGKSFTVYDWTMHVALGRVYRGRKVRQGPVVYCAFEGGHGFKNRVEAYRRKYLKDHSGTVPFYLQPLRIDLIKDSDALIESIERQIETPIVVVLDTLNRSLNGSESKDEDMSAYINAADAIREAFGCTVIIVHHSGINEQRPRGHTSLTGACEAQLSIKKDDYGNSVCTVEFMKDGPEGDVIASRIEQVTLGEDQDGDAITSCVITAVEGHVSRRDALSATAEKVLSALRKAIGSEDGPVTAAKWREFAYRENISAGNTDRAKQLAFDRSVNALIKTQRVVYKDNRYNLREFA